MEKYYLVEEKNIWVIRHSKNLGTSFEERKVRLQGEQLKVAFSSNIPRDLFVDPDIYDVFLTKLEALNCIKSKGLIVDLMYNNIGEESYATG